MASIERSLEIILETDAVVGPLLSDGGSPPFYRIFYEYLPDDPEVEFFSVVYERDDTARGLTTDGPDCLPFARFSFESYGADIEGAIDLDNAIRNVLNGFSGVVDGIDIRLISSDDEASDYTPVSKRNSKEHDYTVIYKE